MKKKNVILPDGFSVVPWLPVSPDNIDCKSLSWIPVEAGLCSWLSTHYKFHEHK